MPIAKRITSSADTRFDRISKSVSAVAGLFNGARGLKRFYDRRDMTGLMGAGSLIGIGYIGDSIADGQSSQLTSTRLQCFPAVADRALKAQLNPTGVGGEGFISCRSDHGRWINEGGGWTISGSNNGIGAPGQLLNTTTLTNRAGVLFDPTTNGDPRNKYSLTGVEFITNRVTGATFNVDMDTGSTYCVIGAGNKGSMAAVTTGTGSGAAADYAIHKGTLITPTTPFTPNNRYFIQVARAAGNVGINGIYAYNGDEYCGVHYMNLSLSGAKLSDFLVSPTAVNATKQFYTATVADSLASTRFNLLVCNCIVNEWDLSDLPTYFGDTTALVAEIQTWPSKPCVLFVISFTPSGSKTTAQYMQFADQLISQIAGNYPDDCAVLVMPYRYPYSTTLTGVYGKIGNYSDYNARNIMNSASPFHPGVIGHAMMGSAVAEVCLAQ